MWLPARAFALWPATHFAFISATRVCERFLTPDSQGRNGLKIDRRDLLRIGLFTGAGLFSRASGKGKQPWGFEHFSDHAEQANSGISGKSAEVVQKPKSLTPYVDALPMPPV